VPRPFWWRGRRAIPWLLLVTLRRVALIDRVEWTERVERAQQVAWIEQVVHRGTRRTAVRLPPSPPPIKPVAELTITSRSAFLSGEL
jgi:hypothetical protein